MPRSIDNALLAKECVALHRYLARRAPNSYAVAKYQAAHAERAGQLAERDWFDTLLVRVGCALPPAMHLVQAYARVFAPGALVRKKAVLLLAITECSPATLDIVQRQVTQNRIALFGKTAAALLWFAVILLAGVILLAPLHMIARAFSRSAVRTPAPTPVAEKGT